MLLRRRAPGIDSRATSPQQGFEHLDAGSLAVLKWLNDNRIDFVLVGAIAQALRTQQAVSGPVAIVPAPYRRNYARLARALEAGRARQRAAYAAVGDAETIPVKLTDDKLARNQRWLLRCGPHDVVIEPVSAASRPDGDGAPSYQELLYEANRFEPAQGVAVEVASPEDIEHYSQLARTGQHPTMRISRVAPAETSANASS